MVQAMAVVMWAMGALAVLMEAPSCGGAVSDVANRSRMAIVWPLTVSARAALSVFDESPPRVTCRGGSLAMHK